MLATCPTAADPEDTVPVVSFHLTADWFDAWRAAYLPADAVALEVGGLAMMAQRRRLAGIRYRCLAAQSNVHTPRFDLCDTRPLAADMPERLLAATGADLVTIDYLPATSRLIAAAGDWAARVRVDVSPQAHAPAVDCRAGYDGWLATQSKRARSRWRKLERDAIDDEGMTFSVVDGRDGLPALLDEMFAVEQSGWKGAGGTAIRDSTADTLFYTRLAAAAAAAGVLRLALLHHQGRLVAFEYGVIGGDRLFLLKVGYDERHAALSIGHVLAALNIRHSCADPAIGWYDKLGNGLSPAHYKLRFADTVEVLYRITLYAPTLRGRMLATAHGARRLAKRMRDAWRARREAA